MEVVRELRDFVAVLDSLRRQHLDVGLAAEALHTLSGEGDRMQTIARARHIVRTAVLRILPPLSSCEAGRDRDVLPATALSVGVGDRLIGGIHFARDGADTAGVYTALRVSGTVGIQTTNLPQGQAASELLTRVDRVDDGSLTSVVTLA